MRLARRPVRGPLCFALLLLAPLRAHGQARPVEAPLTLERALELGLSGSPALLAAEAQEELAWAHLRGARVVTRRNPELSAGGGVRLGEGGPAAEAEVGLSQAIELGAPRARRVAAAEARVAAAADLLGAARRRVAAAVREAYVNAVAAHQLHSLAEEAEALSGRLLQVAEERGAADAATDIEVNLAAVEWARARRDLAASRRRWSEALLDLAELIGLPPGESPSLPDELPSCPEVVTPVQELMARAVASRQDLAALAEQVEAAEAEVRVARAEAWPDLTLGATYSLEDGRDHVVGVALSIPLPVFERGQGAVAEARASADLARAELEAARAAVAREVARAYARYVEAEETAALMDEGAVARVERNLELLELSLHEGSVGIVDVLLLQRELVGARRDAVEAAAELRSARARLEGAVDEEVR